MSVVRGIVLGVETSELLIQMASPAEVAQYVCGDRVSVAATPAVGGLHMAAADLMADGRLYDRHGRPVAFIEDIQVTTPMVETTVFGDASRAYVQGLARFTIRAVSL